MAVRSYAYGIRISGKSPMYNATTLPCYSIPLPSHGIVTLYWWETVKSGIE